MESKNGANDAKMMAVYAQRLRRLYAESSVLFGVEVKMANDKRITFPNAPRLSKTRIIAVR